MGRAKRRVERRLVARQHAFEVTQKDPKEMNRQGFHKPGSQNRNKRP